MPLHHWHQDRSSFDWRTQHITTPFSNDLQRDITEVADVNDLELLKVEINSTKTTSEGGMQRKASTASPEEQKTGMKTFNDWPEWGFLFILMVLGRPGVAKDQYIGGVSKYLWQS
ncbi:hypothetical protein TNCV_1139951 [Trichonephila clavipes]|nr:hypothetical protein TNCV_1139951 [Trichonephila clavipes]